MRTVPLGPSGPAVPSVVAGMMRIDGKSGYVLRKQIWGVYPRESID